MKQQNIITITIEDGSIVEGANSWVTREEFLQYASSMYEQVSNDAKADEILIKAADYINSLGPKLKSSLVERNQAMSFPRVDVTIENWSWSSNEIPRQVLNAQLSLALEMICGYDPYQQKVIKPDSKPTTQISAELGHTNPNSPSKVCKRRVSSTHINLLLKNSGLKLI